MIATSAKRLKAQEQQQHDDGHCYRSDQRQTLFRPHHVFVLARPGQRVACRQVDQLADRALRVGDVGTQITPADIHIGPAVQARVFAFDHRWSIDHLDLGDIRQRDTRALRRNNRQQLQLLHRVSDALRITQIDRIAFPTFDGLRNVHATDSDAYNILHVANVKSVTCRTLAIDINVDITPTRDPLRINGRGAGDHF